MALRTADGTRAVVQEDTTTLGLFPVADRSKGCCRRKRESLPGIDTPSDQHLVLAAHHQKIEKTTE